MDTSHNLTPVDPTCDIPRQHERSIHSTLENCERTDELRRFIRSRLRRRGVHHWRIEDETHETFQSVSVRALQKASTFDPKRGDVDVWLKRIAERIIIDEYRKEQNSKVIYRVIVKDPLTFGDTIEDLLAPSSPRVREVLALLPKKHQEVFRFSYEEGMKGKELARALGCSTPGAARVLGFRLRDDFIVRWAKIAFRRVDACEFA
jgi:RNA polymerase sigma factor (sigma-70 family)